MGEGDDLENLVIIMVWLSSCRTGLDICFSKDQKANSALPAGVLKRM